MALFDESPSPPQVPIDHRADPEPVQQNRTAALISELLEDLQAPRPHACRSGDVARDVRRASPRSKSVRADLGIDRVSPCLVEEPSKPAHTFVRVVRDPELLQRSRQIEAKRDLALTDRPRKRTAEIVLLLEGEVEPLPARSELAGAQVRRRCSPSTSA
jgi:hypothetical protein